MRTTFLCLALVITVVTSVDLTSFEKFKIVFDPKCHEYFLFNGTDNYAYFYQRNGKFELWLTQNSTNYAVYTAKNSSALLFEWNGSLISVNHKIMEVVLYEGIIQHPMKFQSERYLCNATGLEGGDVDCLCPKETLMCNCETLTYKCEPRTNWVLICGLTLAIGSVIFLLLHYKNESIKAVLGSTLSWLVQWRRQVLSRSEKAIPQSDEEESVTEST